MTGSRVDWMEELRQGRHAEQVRLRAICEAQELPYQGVSEVKHCLRDTDCQGFAARFVGSRRQPLLSLNEEFKLCEISKWNVLHDGANSCSAMILPRDSLAFQFKRYAGVPDSF